MIRPTEENGETHYKYFPPTEEELYDEVNGIDNIISEFLDKRDDLKEEDFFVDHSVISNIIVRIDKRKEKFKVFHDDTIMNEIKEVALLAYWFIKMKPLKIVNKELLGEYRFINEYFAVFCILSILKQEANIRKQDFKLSPEYSHKLMYSLKYWSLGIDAFIAMVEALNECPRH